MTQRASQALILGEPDNPERPLRRMNIATLRPHSCSPSRISLMISG